MNLDHREPDRSEDAGSNAGHLKASGFPTVLVLGAGAWGSTLADLLARKDVPARVWDHSAGALHRLATDRHPFGIPDLQLHESVVLCRDLDNAAQGCGAVVFAVASQAVAEVAQRLAPLLHTMDADPVFVLASKGIDIATLSPLAEVVTRHVPGARVGVVSGPCIALEVARRVPTSAVAASADAQAALLIQNLFATKYLRLYTQDDVLGVELGGALKNIIAIAAGAGDGLGFGANSKAALMTRGLAEMARLAHAMGASAQTLFGLAGLGDLTVTCFSPHSRNRRFGELLGKGYDADRAREEIGMTVEGEPTARAAQRLAAERGVDMPITDAVVKMCDAEWTPQQAVVNLMGRELKEEFWGPLKG